MKVRRVRTNSFTRMQLRDGFFVFLFLALFACTPDDSAQSQEDQVQAQGQSTPDNNDVIDPRIPRLGIDELCGDPRELSLEEWAFEPDVVAVGTIRDVDVIKDPIYDSVAGDGTTVSFAECELGGSFSPGIKVTLGDVETLAGTFDGESLEFYVGMDLILRWTSQTTMKDGVLDWFEEERLQPGMRIGGTFFTHRDAYSPGLRPLFQIHDDDTTTFQGEESNCLRYPYEITDLTGNELATAVRNLMLSRAENDAIKARPLTEDGPVQSYRGTHFSNSWCKPK